MDHRTIQRLLIPMRHLLIEQLSSLFNNSLFPQPFIAAAVKILCFVEAYKAGSIRQFDIQLRNLEFI